MKTYALKNKAAADKTIAYIFICEEQGEANIELVSNVDEWELPFILDHFAKKRIWTVDAYHSLKFISQRIVPPDRQNIGEILKRYKLSEYDELELFVLADGRCAQDDCYIKRISIESVPEEIRSRLNRRIVSCVKKTAYDYIITFLDGSVGTFNVNSYQDKDKIMNLQKYAELLSNVCVSGLGSSLAFSESVHISSEEVYNCVEKGFGCVEDFNRIMAENVLSTQEVQEMLNCSRQNVSDLVRRGKLIPLKKTSNIMLFSKQNIMKYLLE